MSFPIDELSNPRFIAQGRLDPHSDHRWFASADDARADRSSFDRLLNGQWRFHYAENPASVPAGFEQPEFDSSDWETIPVPSHIQLEGYDRPQYVNKEYPWDGRENVTPPNAPMEFNPTACYITEFDAPELGADERATLQFDGAEAAIALWVNGKYVGYAEDTFTPSSFDVTDYLQPGVNTLAAQVFKWTSGSWLEDQDFFRFSGIFRDVWLRIKPAAHVEDLRVETIVPEDLATATIALEATLSGKAGENATVSAVLFDEDGEEVGAFREVAEESASNPALETGSKTGSKTDSKTGPKTGPKTVSATGAETSPEDNQEPQQETGARFLELELDAPRLWSAEAPYLYSALVEVRDEAGELTEVVPLKIGVRRFGIEGGLLRINGERVVFRGVNRHEFGENGRVVTREETERDLVLLKRLGVNAIRTAHYPNTRHLYELADELGFYVIDEMNLETHGAWDHLRVRDEDLEAVIPGDDPQWLPSLEDRANNMLQAHKNHPSIVMWSIGNESYGGSDLLQVSNFLRERDTRPIHYEGVFWDNRFPDTSDVHSHMYTPAKGVEEFIEQNPDKPFVLCEYAHAMGNSFGAVDRYMDLADRQPLFQGGFIWDFSDQAVLTEDRYGKEVLAHGGDSGEAPHDGDFCGNGIFFLDRTPKPFAAEVKYLYQAPKVEISVDEDAPGSFTIENRWNFTNTSDLEVKAALSKEGALLTEGLIATDVAPRETGSFDLPFTLPEESGEYAVDITFHLKEATPWAEAGFVVAQEQTVFDVEAAESASSSSTSSSTVSADFAKLEVVEGEHNIGVRGDTFLAVFSRVKGGLVSYEQQTEAGMKPLLKAIPTANFWHAPTSNEVGWGGPAEDGHWLLASRYASFTETTSNPSLEVNEDAATIKYDYVLPTAPLSEASIAYRVLPSGRIDVTLHVTPGEGLPPAPEFGMLFQADADLGVLRWYGEGPEESHVDRRGGTHLGIYEQAIADQLTPYLKPQEAGSHTGVRWAEVTDEDGAGLRFTASREPNPLGEKGMEFSALHWSPFEIENASHHHKLPAVHDTYIRPALMRRGVAGDDTWGSRPHPEFLLPTGPLTFTFSFEGVG